MKNYFGTDGIRFIYQQETKNLIKKIGYALNSCKAKTIIFGHDTRNSSQEIVSLMANELQKKNIKYVGICSTPCIGFLSQKHNCLGVMITASHNPSEFNGIKFFNKGKKLNIYEQNKLNKLIETNALEINNHKKLLEDKDLLNEYLDFLKKEIKPSSNAFVFDCAFGSLSPYIQKIISLINPLNISINTNFDGFNINKNCGATNPFHLQEYLRNNHLKYGFAFDGDGDRVILVGQNKIYYGNQLIYILNKFFKYKDVVLTKHSSLGSIKSFTNQNVKVHITDVGDSHINELCRKKRLHLGGEDSGHILLLDKLITGDGLLNSLILINILNEYDLDDLLSDYLDTPSESINIIVKNKKIIYHPLIQNLLSLYKDSCYVLLRESGTENKVRLFLSAEYHSLIRTIKNKIITYIKVLDSNVVCTDINLLEIDENTNIGQNVTLIGAVHLINSSIGNNTLINNSYIIDSFINEYCIIGPYAHIRNQSKINNHVRIGNFVEIKKSSINNLSKVSHLSYLGDCECGEAVNVGCGTITVNYDGKHKHKTIIGNKVFIGCNSNLIAPISIGNKSFIAAGSTITNSINDYSFAIARSKQTTKENKAKQYPFFQEE